MIEACCCFLLLLFLVFLCTLTFIYYYYHELSQLQQTPIYYQYQLQYVEFIINGSFFLRSVHHSYLIIIRIFYLYYFDIMNDQLSKLLIQQPSAEQHLKHFQESFANTIHHYLPKPKDLIRSKFQNKKMIYPFKCDYLKLTQKCHESKLQKRSLRQTFIKTTIYNNIPSTFRNHFYSEKFPIVYERTETDINRYELSNFFYSIKKIKQIAELNQYQTPLFHNVSHHKNFGQSQSNNKFRDSDISFFAQFQSANLCLASRVSQTQYNLLLQNDINTKGYSNWFYFRIVSNVKKIIKFNILNLKKGGRYFNIGMGILTYSQNSWKRVNTNIKYYENSIERNIINSSNFTLTFQYEFMAHQEVYFAYNYPYTYTQLQYELAAYEAQKNNIFHRKLLTRSLIGNRIDLLTITAPERRIEKKVIIIMARTHPGQSSSSWILKGFLQNILGNSKQAIQLRERFIFKIIPMINPDGVIHGNSRCSLSGRDLNRCWRKPNKDLFPEIFYTKKVLFEIAAKYEIYMILDLHTHSSRDGIFAYGCSQNINYTKCRQFPFILSKVNSNFIYENCNFNIQKDKEGTARVTLFKKLQQNLYNIFTIQCSVMGISNHKNHQQFTISDLKNHGSLIAKAILIYYQQKNVKLEKPIILNELYHNQQLLKIGNEIDKGSESQPSLDNISLSDIENPKFKKIELDNRQTLKSRLHSFSVKKRDTKTSNDCHRKNQSYEPVTIDVRRHTFTPSNGRLVTKQLKRDNVLNEPIVLFESNESDRKQSSIEHIKLHPIRQTNNLIEMNLEYNFVRSISKQSQRSANIHKRKEKINENSLYKIRNLFRTKNNQLQKLEDL